MTKYNDKFDHILEKENISHKSKIKKQGYMRGDHDS